MGIGISTTAVAASAPNRSEKVETTQCSRCRGLFDGTESSQHIRPGEWWLCAACHDKLLGPGKKPTS